MDKWTSGVVQRLKLGRFVTLERLFEPESHEGGAKLELLSERQCWTGGVWAMLGGSRLFVMTQASVI